MTVHSAGIVLDCPYSCWQAGCLENDAEPPHSTLSIFHLVQSQPVFPDIAIVVSSFSYNSLQNIWTQLPLTFRHWVLSWTPNDIKKVVLGRLKLVLNHSGSFGCSFFIMLACLNELPMRIMFVLRSLNPFEYKCCRHVRLPIGRSAKCTYAMFMAVITFRSTHSPCVSVDLPNLWIYVP